MKQSSLAEYLNIPAEMRVADIFKTFNPPPPRPYQKEALAVFLRKKHGIIVMPTGVGKTIVAMWAMKLLKIPTAIIVPTEPLLWQWHDRLEKYGLRNVGLFYGKIKDIRPVTIFIYNSASKHLHKLARFKFIIFDEIHHLGAKTFIRLLITVKTAPFIMGLTATPERLDGKHLVIQKFIPVIYKLPLSEARRQGWVAPVKIIKVPASLLPMEREVYDRYEETIRKAYYTYGTVNPARLREIYAKYKEPLALSAVKALVLRKILLAKAVRKFEKLLAICRSHPGEKILVFSESIESIELARKYLRKHGIKCMVYHSEQPKSLREKILSLWGRAFDVLLSVKALEEGIDVPEVAVGVIIASGTTKRQYIQRLGRIVRPLPGKVARIYIIYAPGTYETKHAENLYKLLLRNL